ncbi:hypothetical protein PG996_011005 [Apiospora saccharicola]|uniref:Uncharacterized protein n=1 Tax=Apiospora saccharicola TaxID=335842 RepID=A0ABR1UDT8_9PEZI
MSPSSTRAVVGTSATSDEASAPEQVAQAAPVTTPAEAPKHASSPVRPQRARRSEPVYNLAKLSGTASHGKRRQKGDAVSDRKRKAVSGTAEETQQCASSSRVTQPGQPNDRGAMNVINSGPAAKKAKKAEAQKGNGNGKKQKGKEQGKGKEKGKEVVRMAGGGTRPGPAVVDTRSEEALRQQLANMEKPRRATYIGAPALSGSIDDLRRRQKTIIMPPVPQIPPTAANASATNPAPVVETSSRDRNESVMSSSSHNRAPQGAPRAPKKMPEANRHDTTTPSPPEKQRQKQQHYRHQSICPTFEGTHIRLDDDEPTQCVQVQDRGVTVERVPPLSAPPPSRPQFSSEAPPVQLPVQQTVERDENSHNRQDSPATLRHGQRNKRRRKLGRARCRGKRRNRRSDHNSTTIPPSPAAAPLFDPETTHENKRGQKGSSSWTPWNRQRSTVSYRGSAMPPPPPPPPPPPAMNKVTSKGRNSTASSRRDSVVPPPVPAGPPRERLSTPWEWCGENSVSPEQRKRSRGAADPVPGHNKRQKMGSTNRHGTADIVDLTSVPLPEPSPSTYSSTYAVASTAGTINMDEQQPAVEYTSSAPPRQQAEENAHANQAEEASTCKRRFMSVPPPLDTSSGRYRVAEVAHKAPNAVNELHLLRMEKRLMRLENQLHQKE